jgi:hypothetical protein
VRFVNALGGTGVERLAPDAAKAFASDLRRRLMQAAPPKAGSSKKATAPTTRAAPGAPEAAAPKTGTAGAPAADPDSELNLDDLPF